MKVLVIKLGYSETLDNTLSLTTSLGDVLRTTVILHFFKNKEVHWLAEEKAIPLLEGNRYINRIWAYNSSIINLLKKEKFDVIINLEKLPKICEFSDSLRAGKYFGFSRYSLNGEKLIELSQNLDKRKVNKNCWQKILAEAVGQKWNKEAYILGYKPSSKIKYDIGFNWTTNKRWTNKAWPKRYWRKLKSLLGDQYSVSWQQGLNSLNDYMDWINSCRLIVTADTLGLHLSLALKKKVIALFGPTSPYELYFYNRGVYLLPDTDYKCLPCFKTHCRRKKQCIGFITPYQVKQEIEKEFSRGSL
jgi:heptosyltransferase-2